MKVIQQIFLSKSKSNHLFVMWCFLCSTLVGVYIAPFQLLLSPYLASRLTPPPPLAHQAAGVL
jgi:hypothetical protein